MSSPVKELGAKNGVTTTLSTTVSETTKLVTKARFFSVGFFSRHLETASIQPFPLILITAIAETPGGVLRANIISIHSGWRQAAYTNMFVEPKICQHLQQNREPSQRAAK